MTVSRSYYHVRNRLLRRYPDYCTATDVAKALGCSKRTVQDIRDKLKWIMVADEPTGIQMILYDRHSTMQFAASGYTSNSNPRRDSVACRGLEAQRMREICVIFYKTQQDRAPKELLNLAKRIGQL